MSPLMLQYALRAATIHMTSDAEDRSSEGTAIEEYPILAENITPYVPPSNGQIDHKIFSPMQLKIQAELASYLDSPYANGNGEQDVSLTELLDEVFNGNDEFTCEESTNLKLAVEKEMQLPHQVDMLQTIPAGNFHVKDTGTYSDKDMAQVQQHDLAIISSGWYNNHFEVCLRASNYYSLHLILDHDKKGSIGDYGDNSVVQVASSADSARGHSIVA